MLSEAVVILTLSCCLISIKANPVEDLPSPNADDSSERLISDDSAILAAIKTDNAVLAKALAERQYNSTLGQLRFEFNKTALHVAAALNSAKVAKHLIKTNDQIANVVDALGRTALFYAVEKEASEDVLLVIIGYSNVSAIDRFHCNSHVEFVPLFTYFSVWDFSLCTLQLPTAT